MSVIVTGGAGFIGSNIVGALNAAGREDIIIVDNIHTSEKWMNIRDKKFLSYFHKNEFLDKLWKMDDVTHIIHMGACSSTTETDFDYLYKNNVEYSKELWNYAAEQKASFLYASSAATYGDGQDGFDDEKDIQGLKPLNRYGYSKHLFDMWAEKQDRRPAQAVGMKFFNVYGPNEYAKGSMASVVYHGYKQIIQSGAIRLFKSYREGIEDGGQKRDFIYVKDICKIIRFLMAHPEVSGLFNIGTGTAETFFHLAQAIFKALNLEPDIRFIDMPPELHSRYQYYTKAETNQLLKSGYADPFYSLEDGVKDYVCEYLAKGFAVN